jgi:hypothetical protein
MQHPCRTYCGESGTDKCFLTLRYKGVLPESVERAVLNPEVQACEGGLAKPRRVAVGPQLEWQLLKTSPKKTSGETQDHTR